jgi:hypothetical protein
VFTCAEAGYEAVSVYNDIRDTTLAQPPEKRCGTVATWNPSSPSRFTWILLDATDAVGLMLVDQGAVYTDSDGDRCRGTPCVCPASTAYSIGMGAKRMHNGGVAALSSPLVGKIPIQAW